MFAAQQMYRMNVCVWSVGGRGGGISVLSERERGEKKESKQ